MLNPAIGSQESLKIDRREFCIDSLRYAAATMLGLYTGLECIRAVVEIADPSSEVVSHPGENEEMTIRAAHLYAENVMMSSHSAKQVGETALQAEVSADFEDDFTSLDTSKWYTCYPYSLEGAVDEGSDGSWNAGTAPLDGAVYDPFSIVSDSSATDGKLLRVSCRRTTAAEQADTGGKAWVGGIIISQEGWASGYLEWRARFPAAGSGTGMWPALWLFGQTQTSGDQFKASKGASEIDMLEIFGVPNIWNSTVHSVDSNGDITVNRRFTGPTDDDWHDFAVDWNGINVLDFYYDNELMASATETEAANFNGQSLCARMNYTITDAASWTGETTNNTTPDPLYFDIDYLKHYPYRP